MQRVVTRSLSSRCTECASLGRAPRTDS